METQANVKKETITNTTPAKPKRGKVFPIILLLLIVAGSWFGVSKYTHGKHHEETDDAQVESNISPAIPRVSGYVADVKVRDNQRVRRGDTLLVLDQRDLALKVEQAEAALATAQSNLGVARTSTSAAQSNIAPVQASIGTIDAQIGVAKINLTRANQDFERYANLIKDHSITQQQYEQALAAKQTAEKQIQILQEQRKEAASQTSAISSQSGAAASQIKVANSVIKQRQVEVDEARLNLSYAVITAPADGLVSKVNVQPGQFVQAGQPLFSIVLNDDLWVVANFKETQFDKMKIGQKVMVHVDAFPDHNFEAKLSSFSPATGARFALLPPDNASGNFVKVVQRVPVRIEFAQPNDALIKQLRPGMNVDVDVHLD
ncbi:MAG: HlyD family secretion protein [Segetibacter sp.]|jgi:membrane fusion protein (multidrug efflux system)|nr:HlyD family secretion protein [Segetibacter sp.]